MTIRGTNQTLREVLGAVVSQQKIPFTGVEFDSRRIRGGELFIALKGEAAHGHTFVSQAYERGAALCLVETDEGFSVPSEVLCIVGDTLEAFSSLAQWWRRTLKTPLLGITGSVGKTTVKEMAARILLEEGVGLYSEGSFNNHTGVPYTLCKLSPEHAWGVIEMGMNHRGEIAHLTRLTEPNAALINKIAPAHIEFLGTIENIARAKLEIAEGLPPGAVLALNKDDDVLMKEFQQSEAFHKVSPRYFGHADDVEVQISEESNLLFEGISFTLSFNGKAYPIQMSSLGTHHAMNAAAATLGALSLFPQLSSEKIVAGLSKFTAPLQRGSIITLKDGRKILDESYNANPASMKATLEIGGALLQEGQEVGFLLGDMLELGEHAEASHQQVAEQLCSLKPSFVYGVGPQFRRVIQECLRQGISAEHFSSPKEAVTAVLNRSWEALIVKSSKGIGLLKLREYIDEWEGPPPAPFVPKEEGGGLHDSTLHEKDS